MNIATLIGEQSLRIDSLEEQLRGQGVDPSAGVDVQELQAKLRAAIEARTADADFHLQEKRRLEQIAAGLRQQLQGSAMKLKLDAEIRGRADDAIGFRRRILELEWHLKHAKPANSAQVPAEPRPQAAPWIDRNAGLKATRGPKPNKEGTLGAAVLDLLDKATLPLSYPQIREHMSLVDRRSATWILLKLQAKQLIVRTGTRRNYRYQKKQQGEKNA